MRHRTAALALAIWWLPLDVVAFSPPVGLPPPCDLQGSKSVRTDLDRIEAHVSAKKRAFYKHRRDFDDVEWVKAFFRLAEETDHVWQRAIHHFFLNRHRDRDAAMGNAYASGEILAANYANAVVLDEILVRHGWPDIGRFGAQADRAAFLIADRADHNLALQKHVLTLLEPLAKSGGTRPDHFALLYDRVAVREGRPQRFGTQIQCTGGKAEMPKLEDAERVDGLRVAFGLSRLSHAMENAVCGTRK